ncbi:hypothetical protein JL721_9590 [Aureococcus anophagefferens]|nr:hypothetical protein JL721_9590 [Aureococcus anophagefferens]
MEGLTQPPVSPERDGGEGFVLTQPPCVDEAGADAPPRIAFVLRPTAAAAAASTEPVELVAESTVVVGREPPADILLVDMERTATTTLRPFVSASHATLRVALRTGWTWRAWRRDTMSDGKTAAGLWLGGERLAAGQERRIAVGATLRFGTPGTRRPCPTTSSTSPTRLNIDMAPLRTGRGRTDETTTTTKLTRNQKKRKRRKQDKDDLQDELDRVKAERSAQRRRGSAPSTGSTTHDGSDDDDDATTTTTTTTTRTTRRSAGISTMEAAVGPRDPGLAAYARFRHAYYSRDAPIVIDGRIADFASCEGVQQGDPASCADYAFATHACAVTLDAELQAAGGFARFQVDDGIAAGPADVVFPALRRYAAAVEPHGETIRFDKCSAWSPSWARPSPCTRPTSRTASPSRA